jgi:hypothetical protein
VDQWGAEQIIVTMAYSLIIVHVGNLVLYPPTQHIVQLSQRSGKVKFELIV